MKLTESEILLKYTDVLDKCSKQDLIEIYHNLNGWHWDNRLGDIPDNWDTIPDFMLNKEYKLPTKKDIISPINNFIRNEISDKTLMKYHHMRNCNMTRLQHEKFWWEDKIQKILGIGFYSSKNKKAMKDLLNNMAESNHEEWVKDTYSK